MLRSHVSRALLSDLRFEVHVCTARPRSRFEKKYNFLELFYLVIIEFSFEDSFSAKIGESG